MCAQRTLFFPAAIGSGVLVSGAGVGAQKKRVLCSDQHGEECGRGERHTAMMIATDDVAINNFNFLKIICILITPMCSREIFLCNDMIYGHK